MKATSIVVLPQDRLLLGVIRLMRTPCSNNKTSSPYLVDGSSRILFECFDLTGLKFNNRLDIIALILLEQSIIIAFLFPRHKQGLSSLVHYDVLILLIVFLGANALRLLNH